MSNPENETVHNVTELPTPKKPRKLHNPFTRKGDSATAETGETNTPKVKASHGIYQFGALLLVSGVVGAAAARFGQKAADSVDVTTTEDSITVTSTED